MGFNKKGAACNKNSTLVRKGKACHFFLRLIYLIMNQKKSVKNSVKQGEINENKTYPSTTPRTHLVVAASLRRFLMLYLVVQIRE